MIVSVLFAVLAAAALAGAVATLVCRRTTCGLASYLVCCSALAGLYGLLDMDFVAVFQLAISLGVGGLCLAFLPSERATRAHSPNVLPIALLALAFFTLTAYAILRGTLGEPTLGALPIWAIPGEHLYTLGSELVARYTILLALLALLLLAGILAAAYVFHQASHLGSEGRRR